MTIEGACCASARDQDELALAAGEAGVIRVREVENAESLQRGPRRAPILGPGLLERTQPRGPAHQNDLLGREGERGRMRLRDIVDSARDLCPAQSRDRRSVQRDAATLRRDAARDLQVAAGKEVYVVIKASEVMLATD